MHLLKGNKQKLQHYSSYSNLSVISPTSQLIFQPFHRFIYVTVHSTNPSVASPTSQFILQPFFCFSYVTSYSLNSPGEPPMFSLPGKTYMTSIEWWRSHPRLFNSLKLVHMYKAVSNTLNDVLPNGV